MAVQLTTSSETNAEIVPNNLIMFNILPLASASVCLSVRWHSPEHSLLTTEEQMLLWLVEGCLYHCQKILHLPLGHIRRTPVPLKDGLLMNMTQFRGTTQIFPLIYIVQRVHSIIFKMDSLACNKITIWKLKKKERNKHNTFPTFYKTVLGCVDTAQAT